jgi:hypothetical protein
MHPSRPARRPAQATLVTADHSLPQGCGGVLHIVPKLLVHGHFLLILIARCPPDLNLLPALKFGGLFPDRWAG